jgi:hypothetical protein
VSALRLALLLVAAALACSCQTASDAAARLVSAVERMELTAARLDMLAVAQAQGNEVIGGSFDQRIRAVGILVPPDRLQLTLEGAGRVQELVIVGAQMWIDAGDGLRRADKVPLGPLSRPTAPLDFIRGPGRAEFAGLGLSRGVLTYRVRMVLNAAELQARMRSDQPVDPDSTGSVEVEIGLVDGLIHRQAFEVREPADPFSGSGLRTLRTTYVIEYWDHGRRLEVREPK